MKLKAAAVIVILIFIACGCAKQSSVSSTTPAEIQSGGSRAEGVSSQSAQTVEESDFQVDLSSKAFPGIHTSVSDTETEWGYVRKKTLHWYDDIVIYHELPVFKEETEVYQKINQYMQGVEDKFFTEDNLHAAWNYEYERHANPETEAVDEGDNYVYVNSLEKICKSEHWNVMSVIIGYEWFMGGTMDYGLSNYNFDMKTGRLLELTDIYRENIDNVRSIVVDTIKANVGGENPVSEQDISWDNINEMKSFAFYICNDEIHVTFAKYEICYGAAGAFDFVLPLPKPSSL